MLRKTNETFVVYGKSEQPYTFYVYQFDKFEDIKNGLPSIGGIYIFTRRIISINDIKHRLIYCGKTGDFSTRYYDHHAENCITGNNANCIAIMRVDLEPIRAYIEKDILETNVFTCNIKYQ